jgi:hypothetical protein
MAARWRQTPEEPFVTTLRDLADGLCCLGRIRLEIETEGDDLQRRDVFLSIWPSERTLC